MTSLNDALVEIIQKTQGAVETGVSFLSQQIPDVIHQLLVWKLAESLAYGVVGITSFVLAVVLVRSMIKEPVVVKEGSAYNRTKYKPTLWRDYESDILPTIVGGGLAALVLAISSLVNLPQFLTALQIYIAPKVWLIEYAAHLAK